MGFASIFDTVSRVVCYVSRWNTLEYMQILTLPNSRSRAQRRAERSLLDTSDDETIVVSVQNAKIPIVYMPCVPVL